MGNLYVYVCAEADAQQLSSCGKPLEAGSISRSRVGLKLNSYLAGVLPCDPTLRNAPLWANLGTENGPDFWTNHIADGEHTRRNHSREEVGIIALNMSSVYEFPHKMMTLRLLDPRMGSQGTTKATPLAQTNIHVWIRKAQPAISAGCTLVPAVVFLQHFLVTKMRPHSGPRNVHNGALHTV